MESKHSALAEAHELIGATRGRRVSVAELRDLAVALAERLWTACEAERNAASEKRGARFARLMQDRRGQVFTTTLTDRAHRSKSPQVTVSQASHLLSVLGVPGYLGAFERIQLGLLERVGSFLPSVARRGMLARIHDETRAYIVTADDAGLTQYLGERAAEGKEVIVNHLGEEVLGESEAARRVDDYVRLIRRPDVHTISVKVSSIASQLDPLAFDRTVDVLSERLAIIHRAAIESETDGAEKAVVLDMEAYRDAELTLAALRRTLDLPELARATGGCAVQAYLPDSMDWFGQLSEWAKRRLAGGGRPVRMRLVKGANLAAERIDSAHRGLVLPIHPTKRDVDANYKRLLLEACRAENARALCVGIASHNVFDVAFGLLARVSFGSEAHVGFELLAGMAEELHAVLRALDAPVRIYSPVVEPSQFQSAVAYLVRRLDENTDRHNFLRYSFGMRLGDDAWRSQRDAFERACDAIESTRVEPRRTVTLGRAANEPSSLDLPFRNEPETDWSRAQNRDALRAALERERASSLLVSSRVVGAGTPGRIEDGFDPSEPSRTPYTIELADESTVERALENAIHAELPGLGERAEMLARCASELRRLRAELIAVMVADAGKRADEGDVEVSEAIDFAEYYARSALSLGRDLSASGVSAHPSGVVVVTPPWNFPLAIPLGGVFAALAAGNAVILKPAFETPKVALVGVEACHRAGVPRDLLQFVVCDDETGSKLIRDSRVAKVVLTGATSTARLFQRMRPGLDLLAETGGKNALIVMPMADRELAIQDALSSAFGHAGQKCSALSQLILHREVHDDPAFLETLRDAAASLVVGSAWRPESRVTPLIQPPNPIQLRALEELEPGESWLLPPRIDAANPRLVGPGIKLGVRPGSFSHQTEFFCPLLSVLRAESLDHAIEIANGTAYGLTSGLHSLDERDQARWLHRIRAGNLYVNRRITGAIVQRQPFGGHKASSFGPGAKAGGPNYVAELSRFVVGERSVDSDGGVPPSLVERLTRLEAELSALLPRDRASALSASLRSTARRHQRDFDRFFRTPTDPTRLSGQDNYLRYLPIRLWVYVAGNDDRLSSALEVAIASWIAGSEVEWFAEGSPAHLSALASSATFKVGVTPEDLVARLSKGAPDRLLVLGTAAPALVLGAEEHQVYLSTRAPLPSGRIELLFHLREQAVSVSTHRYGHTGLGDLLASREQAA